jgi:hypothetical protein
MNIKRITSLTAFLSFFITLLTSTILFIVPEGRVAYWVNWRLFGLSKEQWGAIHLNVGILFLLALMLHIYYNWNPIVLYLKNKSKELKVFTKEFNVALMLVFICFLGTYVGVPPFSTLLKFNDNLKESAAKKYGEPPYGHAELSSLKSFSKKMGIDLNTGIPALKSAGFQVNNDAQTLKDIALNNDVTPQQIYLTMIKTSNKGSTSAGKAQDMPENPIPGTGNLTLADLCNQYNLNIKHIISLLEESKISLKEDMTLKKIGQTNSMSPSDVYDRIRSIASNQAKD